MNRFFITIFTLSVCGFLYGTEYPQKPFVDPSKFIEEFPVKCEVAIRKISDQCSFDKLCLLDPKNSTSKFSRHLITLTPFQYDYSTIVSDDKALNVIDKTDKLAHMDCPEATKKFLKVLMSEQFIAELLGKEFLTAFYDNSCVGDTRVEVIYRPCYHSTEFQVTIYQTIPLKDRPIMQASQFLLHFRFSRNYGALLGVPSERLGDWAILLNIDGVGITNPLGASLQLPNEFEKRFPLDLHPGYWWAKP